MSGLNCIILVNRFTTRWVLSAIFPIMATTWLGFLVFFLPRDDMNGRLGEWVCLFSLCVWGGKGLGVCVQGGEGGRLVVLVLFLPPDDMNGRLGERGGEGQGVCM